jgi:hypothetical protein
MLNSLRIEVVRSKLGTREVVLSFAAENSEHMDRISEVGRVALGHTFTGTNRHFVQYRDAGAPFGYDVAQVMPVDGDYLLYHNDFSQVYRREKELDLGRLLMRLHTLHEPSFGREPGERWLLAEEGVGPALIQYFIRSKVEASVGVVEWPPLSAFDTSNVRRYLFHLPHLPERMTSLVASTPGLTAFVQVAPGIAVQVGFRHPLTLRSCPVFPAEGMVLFRGHGQEPLVMQKLPAMGEITAFAKVTYHEKSGMQALDTTNLSVPPVVAQIRLMPSIRPHSNIRATFITPSEYPLLRQILYALGSKTIASSTIAFTNHGAFLLNPQGVESTPIGLFLQELRPGLYIPAGYALVPAISSDILFQTFGSPHDHNLFLFPTGQALGVLKRAFLPLETAMIAGHAWSPMDTQALVSELSTEVAQVVFGAGT